MELAVYWLDVVAEFVAVVQLIGVVLHLVVTSREAA